MFDLFSLNEYSINNYIVYTYYTIYVSTILNKHTNISLVRLQETDILVYSDAESVFTKVLIAKTVKIIREILSSGVAEIAES